MLGRLPAGTKYVIALGAALVGLAAPQVAQAAIPTVLGGDVACNAQSDGVRFCGSDSPRSTSKAFDGVPLDVNVAFPPEPATGSDGNYPLVMLFHGYGGGKIGLSSMQRWLDRGYATFSMTARGFRESCGSTAAQAADPSGCAAGYVRLDDTRYEVRDAQEFAGRLADEGLIDPTEIAAIGGSYGGGISLALATLRNRKMLPDGSLTAWNSPNGTPMEIAAAAPFITWSDLAYSLAPNGSTLDYVAEAPYEGRFGVMKESLVNGLYISGQGAPGFYAPPGTAGADLTGWKALLDAGEPYDGNPQAEAVLAELTSHHSAYYIGGDVEPAPVLFSNGFTDDLFPADEVVRYYNKVRSNFPDATMSLFFGEIAGHPRSTSKAAVNDSLRAKEEEWFDHFVKDEGEQPFTGVEAFTQTCPNTAAPGGPYRAKTWARISPGEIRAKVEAESDDRRYRGRQRDRGNVRSGHGRRRLRPGAGRRSDRNGQPAPRAGSRRRLHVARRADGDCQVHPPRRHLAGGSAPARCCPRRPGAPHRPWALAARQRRADEAGVPASPQRLALRRRPRGQARVAARRLSRDGAELVWPQVGRPAGRDRFEARAAPASARAPGSSRRSGQRSSSEVPPEGL